MLVVLDKAQEFFIGYAILFAFISVGFLCLRSVIKNESAIGFWAISFLANGLGFLFWSGIMPLELKANYFIGEVLHVAGFFLLVLGSYRFMGKRILLPDALFFAAWILVWGITFLTYGSAPSPSLLIRKIMRSVLFIVAGAILLFGKADRKALGAGIAGSSLMLWGIYITAFAFFELNYYLYYGFLVGFHFLAAFGMVVMLVAKIRSQADMHEKMVEKLEGILPICSYCKRIRDANDAWHVLEEYIETRSDAEFSHGICPECFKKYRPDR